MLDPADILIDRHPVVALALIKGRITFVRGRKTEKVPGGIDKRIHGIGVVSRPASTLRTVYFDKAFAFAQRRTAFSRKRHIFGKFDR